MKLLDADIDFHSSPAMDLILNKDVRCHPFANIILHCCYYLQKNGSMKISFARRETNGLADELSWFGKWTEVF